MSRLTSLERTVAPLSADERDELASAAGQAERANRPAALVVLAGFLFVVACGGLGLAATRQAAAEAEVERRQAELTTLRDLAVDLEVVERLRATGPELPRSENLLSQIESLARAAGIEGDLGFRENRESLPGGIVRKSVSYDIRHPTLAEPMDWVRRVTETISGMKVSRIAITPRANREWRFEVGFERYERAP